MPFQPLPHHLKKAVDILRADLGRGWKVDDLARLCGVPRRTLEKQFRRFIGLAPLEFLLKERLDKVRRWLLRAPPGASITDVATGCGFKHLGRFGIAYRDSYGESPSDTLRRRRVPIPLDPVAIRLAASSERPALAVLPFELIGPQAGRANEISDEIAAALHRTGWIRVVPPPAGRYHLHARVTDDGTGTLRIRMTLLDRSARRYIWAETSQYAVRDLFGSPDWFSSLAAGALRSVLRDAEIDRAASQDPEQLKAWGLCMRALPAILAADLASHAAPELLERAIELAPHDPVPVSLAAWCHGLRAAHHFTDRPNIERDRSLQFAARGSELCAGDPLSNVMLAAAHSLTRDLTTAEAHARNALAVDGGSAWGWGRLAWVHAYRDEAAAAIECCQIARALAPSDPLGFLWSVGIGAANLELGRYDRAIPWYRRALAEQPKAIWVNRFLAPTLAFAGRKEEGRQSLSALLCAFPDLTIADVTIGLPHTAGTCDRFSDGLASLGMRYS